MKFSKNNNCLHFLQAKKLEEINFAIAPRENSKKQFTFWEEMEFKTSLQKSFIEQDKLFRSKIQFVSNAFLNAFEKAKHKMAEVFDKEPIKETGTLFFNGKYANTTLFYYVETDGQKEDFKANVCVLTFLTVKDKSEVQHQLHNLYIDDSTKETVKNFSSAEVAALGFGGTYWYTWIIHFLTFCRYCEIETKVVAPNRKEHHVGQQYKNETAKSIEVLDATWFTTIVRSEGFTVGAETGGFFRWHPVGPGRTGRRLQWIMPYEKEGYTRVAKKLLHENTNSQTSSKSDEASQ